MLTTKLENKRIDFEAMTNSVNKINIDLKAMIQDPDHRAAVELAKQFKELNKEGKE